MVHLICVTPRSKGVSSLKTSPGLRVSKSFDSRVSTLFNRWQELGVYLTNATEAQARESFASASPVQKGQEHSKAPGSVGVFVLQRPSLWRYMELDSSNSHMLKAAFLGSRLSQCFPDHPKPGRRESGGPPASNLLLGLPPAS